MAGGFESRVAVVTGGASGIGLAIAERFAEEGASVALLDREEDRGRAARARIRESRGACEFFRVDVASELEVAAALGDVAQRFHGVGALVENVDRGLVVRSA